MACKYAGQHPDNFKKHIFCSIYTKWHSVNTATSTTITTARLQKANLVFINNALKVWYYSNTQKDSFSKVYTGMDDFE